MKNLIIGAGTVVSVCLVIIGLMFIGPILFAIFLTGIQLILYTAIVIVPLWLLGKAVRYFTKGT